MEKIVVFSPGHAVGESVWLAAKARLYRSAGYKVFLDPASQLKSNAEAYEFLFLKNPFIAGEREPSQTDILDGVVITWDPYERRVYDPPILRARDFTEDERVAKLHYVPVIRPELSEETILDLNISSYRLPGGRDDFSKVPEYVTSQYPGAIAVVRDNYDIRPRTFELLPVAERFRQISYGSIYEYVDIVASCRRVVCLQTGSELIACSYNREIHCLRTEEFDACPSARDRRLMFFDCEVHDIDLTR